MDEPLRILHVFMGMDRSGVPILLINYLRHIDRTKVVFDFAVESGNEEYFDKEIEGLGGRVYSLGVNSSRPLFYSKLGRIIRKGGYDIVHSHMGNRNIPILLCALISGATRRISHSHNTFKSRHALFRYLDGLILLLGNMIPTHRYACSAVAGICMFGKRTFNKGKVTVINNAIEINKFLYDPGLGAAVRNELGLGDRLVIGSVGNFTPLKNHGFMIEVFRELVRRAPSAALVIAGGGRLMESIREKVSTYGLSDNIMLLGRRSDVDRLYQAFDAFILTSFNEGLSIALIEAQASGLRCIVSDNLTQESNPSGTMTVLNLEDGAVCWAENIIRILETPYERKSQTAKLREAGFDIILEARKLEEKYLAMKG